MGFYPFYFANAKWSTRRYCSLNAAKNAGLLAVQILASANTVLLQKMIDYKESLKQAVLTAAATLNDE
ncbi:Phosphoribosylcarboxyaminoimidazole (NCAIR) mutase [Capnocytophaga sputigena]|uniref:Phosphoribosylcarboxyaminoimidazole (NCAIR) mutase n=1 Tax=Capnocytophaga sputigena TaxID=1019 RepID=A0AAX2I7X5_CAPSP|nr:Phosphoribosylcarboxyaminoimidazole (NCAIR) mutase [Capnocytophaga sputigena]